MNTNKKLLVLTILAALLVIIPGALAAEFGGFEADGMTIGIGIALFFVIFAGGPVWAEIWMRRGEKRTNAAGLTKGKAYKRLKKVRTGAISLSSFGVAIFLALSIIGFDVSSYVWVVLPPLIVAIVMILITRSMGKREVSKAGMDAQAKLEALKTSSMAETRQIRAIEEIRGELETFTTEIEGKVPTGDASDKVLELANAALQLEGDSNDIFTAIQTAEKAEEASGKASFGGRRNKRRDWNEIFDLHEDVIEDIKEKIRVEEQLQKNAEDLEKKDGEYQNIVDVELMKKDRLHLSKLEGLVEELKGHWERMEKKHWKDVERGSEKTVIGMKKEMGGIKKAEIKQENSVVKILKGALKIKSPVEKKEEFRKAVLQLVEAELKEKLELLKVESKKENRDIVVTLDGQEKYDKMIADIKAGILVLTKKRDILKAQAPGAKAVKGNPPKGSKAEKTMLDNIFTPKKKGSKVSG